MTHPDPSPRGGDDPTASWVQAPAPGWGQVPYGGGSSAPQPSSPPPGAGWPAPYGQPPQGQPPYGGHPYALPQRTNGMAIASLVLGILWLYWIGSILALVFGYVAKQQIRERGEAGSGMATAGIVLGWVGVGIFAVGMLAGIASLA